MFLAPSRYSGIYYLEKDLKTSIEFHDWEGEAMAYTKLSAAYHILDQMRKPSSTAKRDLKFFDLKESDKVREEATLIFQVITSIVEITQQP